MQESVETRFAVEWVTGDDVTVLKLFGKNEKQTAIDYARKTAKKFDRGIIDVIQAVFDIETQQIAKNGFALYEVFHAGRQA